MELEPDLGIRPKFGVVVSLLEAEDGATRVVLDDVISSEPKQNTTWRFHSFFTHKRLGPNGLDVMALSDEEYQGLGMWLMARLAASNELAGRDGGV